MTKFDEIAHTLYDKPFPDGSERISHGKLHAYRTAIWVQLFANLKRLWNHQDILEVTDCDVKLLQIVALFHDAGREDDGVDRWDKESAKLCADYFIENGCNSELAYQIANNIIDKDNRYKTIHSKLLHDADCLDIIRCRGDRFDYTYLDIIDNELHHDFTTMMAIIRDVKDIIEEQEQHSTKYGTFKDVKQHIHSYELLDFILNYEDEQ